MNIQEFQKIKQETENELKIRLNQFIRSLPGVKLTDFSIQVSLLDLSDNQAIEYQVQEVSIKINF